MWGPIDGGFAVRLNLYMGQQKLEACPDCKKTLSQVERDFQFCLVCETGANFQKFHYHHDGVPNPADCPACAAELARRVKSGSE